jgi:hypothetical protein
VETIVIGIKASVIKIDRAIIVWRRISSSEILAKEIWWSLIWLRAKNTTEPAERCKEIFQKVRTKKKGDGIHRPWGTRQISLIDF